MISTVISKQKQVPVQLMFTPFMWSKNMHVRLTGDSELTVEVGLGMCSDLCVSVLPW